jgi:hypothetical protein
LTLILLIGSAIALSIFHYQHFQKHRFAEVIFVVLAGPLLLIREMSTIRLFLLNLKAHNDSFKDVHCAIEFSFITINLLMPYVLFLVSATSCKALSSNKTLAFYICNSLLTAQFQNFFSGVLNSCFNKNVCESTVYVGTLQDYQRFVLEQLDVD